MKISLIFLSLTFFIQNLNSQLAVIEDPDGFTNVRQEPNGNSKIIYKLLESEIFSYFEGNSKNGWIEVSISKNKFDLYCYESGNYLIGYIHESRFQPIENLPKYKGNNFTFQYDLQKFYAGDKIIEKEGNWVKKINGRSFYGTDGGLPTTEINGINILIDGQKIEVSSALYEDLYECNNNFNVNKIGKDFIISQWNSDGAGGFIIAWVLNKDGIKQRSIWIP